MADERGFHDKFFVVRADGESAETKKHHGCVYFPLDLTHDPCARMAALHYAEKCADCRPNLSHDLRMLVRLHCTDEERIALGL